MIVSGGENVYPAEVENALMAHPAIADVAVIGVPDAKWGEVPKALVVLKPNAQAGEIELIEHCRSRLAHYKCPRSIEFLDESLPRTGTGKVLNVEGILPNKKATVFFEGVGQKQLLLKFAKLKIVIQ